MLLDKRDARGPQLTACWLLLAPRYLLDYPLNSTKVDSRSKNEGQQDALDVAEAIEFKESAKLLRTARKRVGILNVPANPRLLPGGYIGCVCICLAVYLLFIRPATTATHPRLNTVSLVMGVIWALNWRRTSTADPGTASTPAARDELRRRLVDGDGAPLAAGDVCYSCTIVKPLRSKHCQ